MPDLPCLCLALGVPLSPRGWGFTRHTWSDAGTILCKKFNLSSCQLLLRSQHATLPFISISLASVYHILATCISKVLMM